MPKVSVIVPVYNVEQYIERCMQSILTQSLSDVEIIVVDDCTPDNSMKIVRELSETDSRINIVSHNKNMGLMWTRRTGYQVATGDYITFCDSDDYLPENSLKILYNMAIESKADIVSGNCLYIKTDGTTEEIKSALNYGSNKKDVMKSLLLNEYRHNLCAKLFERSILQKWTYQTFENFTNGEDGCLFYQVVNHADKIVHLNKIVYNYMQNLNSSTQVRYNDNALRSICITNKIRHDETSHYPELETIRHRCITHILYWLYTLGYGYKTNLNKYISDYGLKEYKLPSTKYFSIVEIIKLLLRRYAFGLVNYKKSK